MTAAPIDLAARRNATAGAVSFERQAVVELLILRSRWLEAVTFDRQLTAAEMRIATGAICRYLNRDPEHGRFGMFWMSAARLAGDLWVHERTVQRALRRLPMLGYCEIVEPGGGRQKPGVYRPKLPETSAPAPTFDRETSAPAPIFDRETSALESLNVSARIPETSALALTNSGKNINPVVREKAARELLSVELRARIGNALFKAWFIDVEVVGLSDGVLKLSAPSKFIRRRILDHFVEDIVCCGRRLHPSFERVEVTVRS
jgi:hypothetical protein